MPPGPLYNSLCILHSVVNILSHAAQLRAAQISSARHRQQPPTLKKRKLELPVEDPPVTSEPTSSLNLGEPPQAPPPPPVLETPNVSPGLPEGTLRQTQPPRPRPQPAEKLVQEQPQAQHEPAPPRQALQHSRVPSSRIGRLFHYGGLAASVGYGAVAESLRRSVGQSNAESSSLLMTPANIARLVDKLTKMRGAALKLGQFLSIQDTHLLSKDAEAIFRKVQDSAHYMPNWQMERVMTAAMGPSWQTNFASFEAIPFAAASLGQVHNAVLSAAVSPSGREENVAVKIQFPDIARSIDSDLGYMKILLTAGSILPKGLFLENTMKVMKEELAAECDYVREANSTRAFREWLKNDSRYKVPWVWDGSTSTVLVMERMRGASVGNTTTDATTQSDRDEIAARIVELCMNELFVFRTMQTDPNWTNFFWNTETRQIELLDFGATREYSEQFINKWFQLLQAAVSEDYEGCVRWSKEVGYLTGEENEVMLDAHVRSLTLVAAPFQGEQPFEFGRGTKWEQKTSEIRSLIPVMLKHRLTPPPRETYSLNRKLSGAFLLASRLNARVDCKRIWDRVVGQYQPQ